MRLVIPGFTGLNKRTAPEKIQETEATTALDCNFRTGDLQGYYADADSGVSTGAVSTLYDYTPSQELVSSSVMDVVKSPVVNDSYGRFYLSAYDPSNSGNYARVIDSTMVSGSVTSISASSGYALGVPSPAAPAEQPGYQITAGTISSVTLYICPVGKSGTTYQTVVNTPTAIPSSFRDGTQLAIACAGINPDTYSINVVSGNSTQFNLTKTGSAQHKIISLGCINQNGNIGSFNSSGATVSGGAYATASGLQWTFKANSTADLSTTNLQPGDQIVLSYKTTTESSLPSALPTNAVYTVASINGLYVTIDDAAGDGGLVAPSTPIRSSTISSHGSFYWAKIVSGSNAMQSAGIAVTTDSTGHPTQITYTIQSTDADNWEIASDSSTLENRAYLWTYVNKYGEESQPSQPTNAFDVVPGSPVTFPAGFIASSGGYLNSSDMTNYPTSIYAPLVGVRLYRTDTTGTFRLVVDEKTLTLSVVLGSGDSNGNVYTDTVLDANLDEPVPTIGWAPPPKNLQGLVAAPGGVNFGFYGNTIVPSVAYAPYAFPVAYQLATDSPIIGQVVTSAGVAVLTQARPYLVTGTDPSSLSAVRLEVPYACVSHKSIVDMGSCAMYASSDGLVMVQGADITAVTEDIMTRQQWQNYNPSTIIAGHSESKYIGSYVPLTGGARKGFMYDVVTGAFCDITLSATAFSNDWTTDTLKYVNASGEMMLWNRGSTYKTFTWTSKAFQVPVPSSFSCAQVVAYNYSGSSLTFQLFDYETGTQIGSTITITNNKPFRLPSGKRYRTLQAVLSGSGTVLVSLVAIATSIDELKEV